MSDIVWVAEEVLDHQAGWIRGVFSSLALAIESVLAQDRRATWTIGPERNGGISISSGDPLSGTCVSIEPHEIDATIGHPAPSTGETE